MCAGIKKTKGVRCGVSNPFLGTKGIVPKPALVAGFALNEQSRSDTRSDKEQHINPDIKSLMASHKTDILPYKLGKIYEGEEDVFIYYYYYSRAKERYIRKKVRPVASGVKLPKPERLALLRQSLPVINKNLKERNAKGLYHEDLIGVSSARSYTQEILNIINEKKLPESTLRTLSSYRSSFMAFEASTGNNYFTYNVDMPVLHQYCEYMKKAQQPSSAGKPYANKTINEYLWGAQVVADILKSKGLNSEEIKTAELHVKKIKNQTLKYRPLTAEEKEAIFRHTRQTNPSFYLYLLHIYYTCIRLSEAKRLLIKNYDLRGRKIMVPWYSAKNGLTNHVQILAPLGAALRDMKIKDNPATHYIFGKQFAVGAEKFSGKSDSDIWRRECRKIGVPDDANMYGLKHTFNVDYVENNIKNIDWEWLRRHNRHATIQQTQEYIYSLMPHFLDETKSIILNYYGV